MGATILNFSDGRTKNLKKISKMNLQLFSGRLTVVRRMNDVTPCSARLVLGLVTVFGPVHQLGTFSSSSWT